jgi:hypothetical protein
VAIAHTGDPVGESAVIGQEFKQGVVAGEDVVVVMKHTEPYQGQDAAVVVTCMTPEELSHNGNNIGRAHGDS